MPVYGYARVSTFDQDLTIQRAALKAAGCGVVRAEKASGSRRDGRTELQVLLDFVQPGDTLVVTRIDRLARSMKDLQNQGNRVKENKPDHPSKAGLKTYHGYLNGLLACRSATWPGVIRCAKHPR